MQLLVNVKSSCEVGHGPTGHFTETGETGSNHGAINISAVPLRQLRPLTRTWTRMIYGEVGYFGCVLAKLSITPFSSALHFPQQVSGISDVTLLRKGRCHRVERVWTRNSKHSETHRGPLAPHFLRKGLFNLTVSLASIQSLHPSSSVPPTCLFVSHTPSSDSLQNISSFPQLLPFNPRLGRHD